MVANAKAAAYYDPWKYKIDRLDAGDIVFLYRNGDGIVGFGTASGNLEVGAYHGDPNAADEEFWMHLEPFIRVEVPMRAREIKAVAERNVSFQQTMVRLDPEVGRRLLRALQKTDDR